MTLSLIAGPASEPVDLADAKLHLRVDGTGEDALIEGLIAAARLSIEARADMALIVQTWEWTLDAWPAAIIDLPLGPVSAITGVSVDGETLPASDYALVPGRHARLVRSDRSGWPVPSMRAGGITIAFEAGFGANGADVPRDLRHAVLMLVAYWFENREPGAFDGGDLPRPVTALIAPYRKPRL